MSIDQLPHYLAERTRVLREAGPGRDGEFVLYWMHHAARAHENPALDAAVEVANRRRVPVLVYQGLGGRHRYNSDRHHTFILEGARDVHRELGRKGVAHAFYLATDPGQRSPLRPLAARAALVVVEQFPAPPFPRWTQRLAQGVETPVWAVDCRCVVPMQWHGRRYDRAYQLRSRARSEYERRLHDVWPEVSAEVPPFHGNLGFEPLELEKADIAQCCAACDIDHTIGPVPHTVGGFEAGYARWRQFKDCGLDEYAALRNDPAARPPRGVSRMSPYLHYGHVSPFRIARDAAGRGADKFLDELLIWRELAHNLCFYEPNVETLAIIPDWARKTLVSHEVDPREGHYSWERLARGQTDDRLWDAAQRSLLVHGELHNNVRMTWGKALLKWTRSAADALRLMIDLNHRYALDGSDPNSYGGILWCLGLFDRPFRPEAPVYGAVRTRSTAEHAERIDLNGYHSWVIRPSRRDGLRVAIVGAGVSGLFAARILADHGVDVQVCEKSRGTGGRMATRRIDDLAFDIGAQYFTTRDERFRRYVNSWIEEDLVRPWEGRIAAVSAGKARQTGRSVTRYVGVPTMTAVSRHLADGLKVAFETRVAAVRRRGPSWQLVDESGDELALCDAVIVAVPPMQAAPLLAGAPPLAERASSVVCRPCWAAMGAFDQSLEVPFDGVFLNSSPLSWAARNSSKPGRPQRESWVFHATAEWSDEHLEADPMKVAAALLEEFSAAIGVAVQPPALLQAHRWRYAKAEVPLTVGCLWDPTLRIGACGDWCAGSRVEGAVLSAMAVAGRVMGLPEGP